MRIKKQSYRLGFLSLPVFCDVWHLNLAIFDPRNLQFSTMLRKLTAFLVLTPAPILSIAQESVPVKSFDEKINEALEPVTSAVESAVFFLIYEDDSIGVPFVLVWLIAGALFFTIFFRFINIRGFKTSINIVRGKYTDPNDKGEVSPFQALTAALSATVGLGNIAGVAIAISIGGPGATFWMIVAGLLGMSTKFVECTLGVKYRKINEDGSVSGGPMYYLSRGLGARGGGWKTTGMILAGFFAIMCIGGSFGGGNMFQINQATTQLIDITGGTESFLYGKGWVFGLIMAVLVGVVIIGGIKSIARVTDKIVPAMCGIYVVAALIVIFGSIDQVGSAFSAIFNGAFTETAVTGGLVGVLIQGFKRAAFSNEAGVGSAAIAHSAVKTNEPVSEGLVALLEPFIDTVVVCTMTALVIIITGEYANFSGDTSTEAGIQLTSAAFSSVITWFPYVLTIAVLLFAFSTMVSWSYYGLKAWTYLFGHSKGAETSYKIIFCGFVVLGASMSLGSVTRFSDAMIFAMCFPNVFGLLVMSGEVRRDLKSYMARIKSGEIKAFK